MALHPGSGLTLKQIVHEAVEVPAFLLCRTSRTAVPPDIDGLERGIELVQFLLGGDVLRELRDQLGPYPVADGYYDPVLEVYAALAHRYDITGLYIPGRLYLSPVHTYLSAAAGIGCFRSCLVNPY